MLFNLIGPVMVGILAACVLYAGSHLFRLKPAKWAYPAAIGASMLVFHVYQDYTWADHTVAGLPGTVEIVQKLETSHPLQPWTLIKPKVNRMSGVDAASVKVNPAVPGIVLAEMVFLTRYMPTAKASMIYDCGAEPRRADMPATPEFGADGMPLGLTWIPLEADDVLRAKVCEIAATLS